MTRVEPLIEIDITNLAAVPSWVSRRQADFRTHAAAGILVLLALLPPMNAIAIWLRDQYQKKGAA